MYKIAPRCPLPLRLTVHPKFRGWHEWTVRLLPVRLHHISGSDTPPVEFTVQADAQTPLVQISDVRQESPVTQPISMLWAYCQVDELNELMRQPVTQVGGGGGYCSCGL